ncbi:MAG: kinase subunit of RNA polymerase II carboxy-terminal domain kinase I [Vezdaea acicularis]|nr:MAG: kinase subunit of RNA polymerase II carboxy-terminal domain kinase I [Vezdaea acicularis]
MSDRRSPEAQASSRRHRSRSPSSRKGLANSDSRQRSPAERRKEPQSRRNISPNRPSPAWRYSSSRRPSSPRLSERRVDDDRHVSTSTRSARHTTEAKRRSPKSDRVSSPAHTQKPASSTETLRDSSTVPRLVHGHGKPQGSTPPQSSHWQQSRDVPETTSNRSPLRSSEVNDGDFDQGRPDVLSTLTRTNSTRKEDRPPPSPPRPIPSFTEPEEQASITADARLREAFPLHGMKGGEIEQAGQRNKTRPQLEARQPFSNPPQYAGSNPATLGSPQGQPSYHGGRNWAVQSQPYHGQHGAMQSNYPNQQFRGNHITANQERRFQTFSQPQRGRGGHFTNLHWNAPNNGRGIARGQYDHQTIGLQQQTSATPVHQNDVQGSVASPALEGGENEILQIPKSLQRGDESARGDVVDSDARSMPPPTRALLFMPQEKSGSKVSFTLKAKATAASTPKGDLSQKLREPSARRDPFPPNNGNKNREDARPATSEDGSMSIEKPRREPRKEKKTERRMISRPTLQQEFAASSSVYFRKPGNESVVGSGTYGKVFKAIHVYTKNMVALKKIRMEGERDGFPVTAVREIKLLQSLKHHNVVSLQEVMVEKNDCFMVFEYLSHDLTGLLNHPTFKLEEAHKKHLAKQLFEGLEYLHRRGVLHRDIKAANILVSNEGQLKLADFGLARFFAKRRQLDYTNRVITIWYRSPELLLGETQYGPAVDIWSAACVLVEIFTRHAIFPGDGGEISQLDKIHNVLGTPTTSEWPGLVDMAWFELLRPTEKKPNVFAERYQSRLTAQAFDLLSAMFLYDPARRPTASEVLEHPYFIVEAPKAKQAIELRDIEGDWHEFESKALRKENERQAKEARKAYSKEHQREKEKRRASTAANERDSKRARPNSSHSAVGT